MGILQGISVFGTLSDQLLKMAENSFNKERKLYKQVKENSVQITEIKDLNPDNCKKIFDSILNIETDIFEPLRDNTFYYSVAEKLNGFITKQDINEKHNREKNTKLFKNRLIDNFKENIKLTSEDKIASKIIETFLNQLGLADDKITNIKEKQSLPVKIEDNEIRIIISAKDKEEQKIIAFINGDDDIEINNFNWDKQDTFNFIATIEEATKTTILTKNFQLKEVNNKNNNSNNENRIEAMVNTFINYFTNYPELYNYLNNKRGIMGNLLQNDPQAKDLLLGNKTMEKIKGNIGEFLMGIMLKAVFINSNDRDEIYQGSTPAGYGEHQVDIFINNMGFQVKNFPSQEDYEVIVLYPSHSSLYIENKIQESDKYLTKKNKRELSRSVFQSEDKNIDNVLIQSLPNFMRISSNYKETESATREILKSARTMENCFYIVNFRLIPASRLLWELAQEIKAEEANMNNIRDIRDMFCIAKNNKKKNELSTDFYDSEMQKGSRNIYIDSALYFRGIPLIYKNIKLGTAGKNFLADTFKIDYHKYK